MLAAELDTDEQHNLRKIVTEINIKVLQIFAILRSQLVEVFNSRIETTCLMSLVAQNWSHHKEMFTSTSWIGYPQQDNEYFRGGFMDYLKGDQKQVQLSPSRAITSWRLQMIRLNKDLTDNLRALEEPNLPIVGISRNTLHQ